MPSDTPAFEEARANARRHIEGLNTEDESQPCLPYALQLHDFPNLVENIVRSEPRDGLEAHECILVGEAYLRQSTKSLKGSGDDAMAARLRDWTVEVISPTQVFADRAPFSTDRNPPPLPEELSRIRSMKTAGLRLLSNLQNTSLPYVQEPTVPLLTCLSSFTDTREPWTTPEAYNQATSMLLKYIETARATPNLFPHLLTSILKEGIKPLFFKSKNPSITPQGRKSLHPLPCTFASTDLEAENKPWKFTSPHIITVFSWILQHLNAPLTESNWPLIIPPLLALVDDVSLKAKVRGCELLYIFLRVTPTVLLNRSGLGEVFHDALVPCLMYLPSLTSEEDAIPVLEAAYTTLLALAGARFPANENRAARIKMLDEVLRQGILRGYAYAGEHVKIAEVLLRRATDVVQAIGIHCVKHFKYLFPIITAVLTAPFVTAYPPLLQVALQTLATIISNGWPRVAYHRGGILEGLTICWCRIQEEEKPSDPLLAVQQSIRDIVRILTCLESEGETVKAEFRSLSESDDRLRSLLTT